MNLRNYVKAAALLGILLISSCARNDVEETANPPETPAKAEHRIDHVIVAINDLEKGIAKFEELTGVKPVVGGEHPGRGTHNALVSIGEHTYLEIISPRKNLESAEKKISEYMQKYEELTPIGWAVTTSDPNGSRGLVAALDLPTSEIQDGSRVKPDGTKLEWRTFAIREGFSIIPFFINWGENSAHPSTTSPKGVKLVGFSLASPEPDKLSALIKELGLDVKVSKGDEKVSLELDTPNGKVVLPVVN